MLALSQNAQFELEVELEALTLLIKFLRQRLKEYDELDAKSRKLLNR